MGTKERSTNHKIQLFAGLFQGLRTAYGTYSPETGKHWQVKKHVNKMTIYNHLKGQAPYGFYPLVGNHTRVGIVDFDDQDPEQPIHFIAQAEHHGITAYLERSKSKGFHVWLFFPWEGAPASKVRMVLQYLLDEIEAPDVEIFPKQDEIHDSDAFGNFINAPLFGRLAPAGKTVFIRPDAALEPYPDQWEVLESILRIPEIVLDSIIEINNLQRLQTETKERTVSRVISGYGLPICIRRMLEEGVSFDQRIACFRVAVHLKRIGLPYEGAIAALHQWSKNNKPVDSKRVITLKEIEEQAMWAYKRNYSGYGCQESVIRAFCDPMCPVRNRR